jgi:hypothetical protein
MLRAFEGVHGASIPLRRRGVPLVVPFLPLCVHRPGNNTTGRRLLQTDLARMNFDPRARASVLDASGIRREARGVNIAPVAGRFAFI